MNFSTPVHARTSPRVLAFTTLAMVPALVFYVVAERQLIGGLTGRRGEGMMAHDPRPATAIRRSPIEERVADLLGADDARREARPARARSGRSSSSTTAGSTGPRPADASLADGIGQVTRVAGRHQPARRPRWPRSPTRSSGSWSRRPGSGSRRSSTRRASTACWPGTPRASSSRSARPRPGTRSSSRRWPTTIRRRMLATGARQALAPVLDITRDPRWGRIEETYGEDPYLVAVLGCAYVRGAPGATTSPTACSPPASTWSATAWPRAASTRRRSHIGPRELRDEQLFPFEAAVRAAGLARDDARLLRRRRRALPRVARAADRRSCATSGASTGSSSPTTSALEMLVDRAPADRRPGDGRGGMALRAGVDVELPQHRRLRRAAARGHRGRARGQALVDAAVARVLRHEVPPRACSSGRTWTPPTGRRRSTALARRRGAVAGELAARSLVLLENDGVLPLATGPRPDRGHRADRGQRPRPARRLRPPRPHRDAARDARARATRSGSRSSDAIEPADELAGRRTILDAIARRASPAPTSATPRGMRHPRRHGRRDRRGGRRGARRRDVAILVLGERSGLTDDVDDRRVPRSAGPRLPGPPAGAARGGRRDGHAGRPGGRQRAPARASSGRPSTAPRSSSPGCRARRARRRSRTSSSATRTRAASCR